jgi:hypothetical protein
MPPAAQQYRSIRIRCRSLSKHRAVEGHYQERRSMTQKHMYGTRGALLVGVAALASACSGDSPTNPSELQSKKPVSALAAISCTGDVSSKTLACAPASDESGLRGNLIVGGQGVYVRLSADPTTVPGPNSVTITNVRIQNLMAKALGMFSETTPSPDGVRVIFHDLGNVEPANPDGYGEFTALHQAFYTFPGPIESGATSGPRSFTLNLAPGTTTYTFSVYVVGAMSPDNEYLRWANLRPASSVTYQGVFGVEANDVWIVGNSGSVLRYDGTNFTASTMGTGNLNDVWGNSSSNVYAVGNTGAFRWDGSSWNPVALSGMQTLWDVDGASNSNIAIAGMSGGRAAVFTYNGTSWTTTVLPATATGNKVVAYGMWVDRASNFAVATGNAGAIWHRVGGVWSAVASPVTTALQDVWGTSASNIYAVGVGGTVLRYDGTSWSRVTVPVSTTPTLWSVFGTSANDIYVGGNNAGAGTNATILRFDGTTWRAETSPSAGANVNAVYVAGGTNGEPFAVGSQGTVFRGVR